MSTSFEDDEAPSLAFITPSIVDEIATDENRERKKKEKKEKKDKKEKKSKRSSDERRSSRVNGETRRSRRSDESENGGSKRKGECESPPRHDVEEEVDRAWSVAEVTSPSAVSSSRLQSPVIKTTGESTHELSEGRPSIVLPNVAFSSSGVRHRNSASGGSLESLTLLKKETLARGKSHSEHTHTTQFLSDPHPLRLDAWSETSGTSFQIRGAHYMSNKVKCDSLPTVFRLLTVDLVKCNNPVMTGMCSHPNERIQRALAREQLTGIHEFPEFVFAINLVIPSGNSMYHSVFYFGIDDVSIIKDETTPFGRLANRFFFGNSDHFRNETFKLIPRIVEGNYLVRKAVGSKPAILGRKIKQTYIRTDRFMELIVDIASDSIANKIVTLSLGYAKTLAVDMAFVLEGNDPLTLPEQILAAVRMNHIDFKQRDGQRRIS